MLSRVALLGLGVVLVHGTLAAASSAAAAPEDDFIDYPAAYALGEPPPPEPVNPDAPRAEFSLGVGYARVEFDGSPPLVDGRDCIHFDPVVMFSPLGERLPQLRLGGAVGWTMALDDTSGAIISGDNGLIIATSSDVAFMLFEPELRLAWRHTFGPERLSFIEAGGAAGLAVAWLDVSGRAESPTTPTDEDFSETDTSFEWKVFLRAGFPLSTGLAGIEMSYMRAGNMELTSDVKGEPNEFYIGIFGALQF